jgi:hypothetical protein
VSPIAIGKLLSLLGFVLTYCISQGSARAAGTGRRYMLKDLSKGIVLCNPMICLLAGSAQTLKRPYMESPSILRVNSPELQFTAHLPLLLPKLGASTRLQLLGSWPASKDNLMSCGVTIII